jgi:aryl-alcohol dehydrogenase-like predicted oxidoreductase
MTVEKRPFGRTGHMSSAVIFGSAALKAVDQGVADRVLDLLFEHGVNHIDYGTQLRRRRAADRIVDGPPP